MREHRVVQASMIGKRILVVDDDSSVRMILVEGLRQGGYEVLEAASGEDAIALCGQHRVDLAILDYQLPAMSGLQIADALRTSLDVPFFFLTAHNDRRIVGQAVEHGAQSYLLKPVRIAEVLPQVEAALSRSAEARNLGRAATETRRINVAIGILMAECCLSREDAFERLRSICRPRRLKASEAAAEIVDAFEASLRARSDFHELTARTATGTRSR